MSLLLEKLTFVKQGTRNLGFFTERKGKEKKKKKKKREEKKRKEKKRKERKGKEQENKKKADLYAWGLCITHKIIKITEISH